MGRKAALNDEQVEMIRQNLEKRTNKQWALHFGVSEQTVQNARVGRGVYGKNTTEG